MTKAFWKRIWEVGPLYIWRSIMFGRGFSSLVLGKWLVMGSLFTSGLLIEFFYRRLRVPLS